MDGASARRDRRGWWPWLIVGALGIALRLAYLAEFAESPLFRHPHGPDVQEYVAWAREILAGRLLWPEVRIHSPLYPYFLAALQAAGLPLHAVRVACSSPAPCGQPILRWPIMAPS